MVNNKNPYMYGAAAPKIEYNVYEENPVLKTIRKVRVKNKHKYKFIFNLIIIFVLLLLITNRIAITTELNYAIASYEDELTTLKDENSRLISEIENSIDLIEIKYIAETKLSMRKPYKHEIKYVSVQKNDFSVVSGKNIEKDYLGETMFAIILKKIGSITNLFY